LKTKDFLVICNIILLFLLKSISLKILIILLFNNRNSSLQCLIHLKDFITGYTEFIEKNNHICANNKLLCQFNKILENLKLAYCNKTNKIRINDFYLFFTKEFNTNFVYNTEQDSLEFTRNLIENFARYLVIPKNNNFYTNNKKIKYVAKTDRNLGFQV
jgi:hypothetical protein